jgi:hypothetical protein
MDPPPEKKGAVELSPVPKLRIVREGEVDKDDIVVVVVVRNALGGWADYKANHIASRYVRSTREAGERINENPGIWTIKLVWAEANGR